MRQPSPPTDVPPSAASDPIVRAAVIAAIVQIAVVWIPPVPLGIPGEWEWQRIQYGPGEIAALFLGAFIAIPAAIAYIAFCRAGDRRLAAASPSRRRLWLLSLVAAAFAWLWVVQQSAPGDLHRLGRAPVVLYFPSFSGYFTEARAAGDFGAYLADYEGLMAEGDVLHIGTHPPGLTTAQHLLLSLFERSPGLTQFILSTRPASVHETQAMLLTLPQQPGRELTNADLAVLWAAAVLVQLCAAAAVVPLFQLVERSTGIASAWRVAACWPLVTAVALFLPKSDALFPLIGMSVLAAWYGPSLPGVLRSAAAGTLFWFGMTLSLAMLPVAVLAACLSIQPIATGPSSNRRRIVLETLRATTVAGLVFGLLSAAVWLLCDLNLVAVWWQNYQNHAGFYDEYVRTYWKWLLAGPVELAFAIGLPLIVAVIAGVKRSSLRSPAVPVLCVIGLLWLSGKNAGEAARLWLFLMPWLLWLAAPALEGESGRSRWRILLPLQLVASFLTAVRISGFGFDEFLNAAG